MQPQTEQQLIQVLQQIASYLSGINQKLAALQTLPSHLNNIASKTGR
jgi:prefoldin subunit 5